MRRIFLLLSALSFCVVLVACGHSHTWSTATCEEPMTCSECGETNGEPMGHMWKEATCESAKTCVICEKTDGEVIGHKWKDATCTTSKTCLVCAATEGTELGHKWQDATCTQPKTCVVCQETDGAELGHDVVQWKTTTRATCSVIGEEEGKCKTCEEIIKRTIPKKEHTPGSWKVTKEATDTEDGRRERQCTVCKASIDNEKYSLTKEEKIKYYKKSCQQIAYNDLARNPGYYEGERVKFFGTVVQVCSEASSSLYYSTYRVATNGSYRNVIYIYVDNYGSGSRILEDDRITIYGEFDGLYTYTTVMGASVTIPSIKVEYIE